ncbi:MAG TPA: elongation factor P [Oligoflexia bacterium]|nr:elongation factor P [Oligoflexia bacterium]HMP26521.1 elongation factor P [Oligoflexia bacterium]
MKASDLRRGNIILHNNTPYSVMDFHHHTPGNLRALVQLKLRNLLTGNQTEIKLGATDDVQPADVVTYPAVYLYADQGDYFFMNNENYEEVKFPADQIGEKRYFLQEQMAVHITFYNGQPINVELPGSVKLKIVETDPELKGATITNTGKPAKTDTGLALSVPQFIKQGETILVSTTDGKYLGRAD